MGFKHAWKKLIFLLFYFEHFVFATHNMCAPWHPRLKIAIFGMGNFWHAERIFLQCPGVYSTQVGYSGGQTPNPTYKEVRTGMTNHARTFDYYIDPDKNLQNVKKLSPPLRI